jgi:hypothetical protein
MNEGLEENKERKEKESRLGQRGQCQWKEYKNLQEIG